MTTPLIIHRKRAASVPPARRSNRRWRTQAPNLAGLVLALSACKEPPSSPSGGTGSDGSTGSTSAASTSGDPAGSTDDSTTSGGSEGTGSSGGSTSSESETTETGTTEDSCVTPVAVCPEDAPVVGQAGEFSIDEFDIPWTDSTACNANVGPVVYARIPDDVVSFSATIDDGDAFTRLGLVQLDDEVLIDINGDEPLDWGGPPLYEDFYFPAASIVFPMSPQTEPRGGCLAIWPLSASEESEGGTLMVTTRRDEGAGTLDLDFVVVGETVISDAELEMIGGSVDELYSNGNAARIGELRIHRVEAESPFVTREGIGTLLQSFVSDDPTSLTVYFVADFLGQGGTLGLAGGVPGPNGVQGTAASGVTIGVDIHTSFETGTLDIGLMSETVAHEVGHQLGLFHTSEAEGTFHDQAPDTPECSPEDDLDGDGMLSPSECPDGSNFMFWTSEGEPQTEVSPFQSDVIFLSPIVE